MRTPALKGVVAALAVAALVAAGCGDDDDDAAGTTDDTEAPADSGADEGASSDVDAYCEASLATETLPAPEIDFATATEEEIGAAYQAWAEENLRPAIDAALAVVPEEIGEEADLMSAAVDQMIAGDPSATESPDFAAAQTSVHQYDLDNCGWTTQEVSAKDYAFEGLPDEVPAGVTSFEFSNGGAEVHELILVKKNDGVTDSAEDLLALPEEESMAKVTMLGEPAFALPGESHYKVADLEPGDYVAVCFIPTGMTGVDGPPPDGPPHFTHGMFAEFTVA
jgi:hypothetical protein